MQENSNHSINSENLDTYLGSMGFLYPINEVQLDIFNILYGDFDFKLKDLHIDVDSIINNKITKKSVIQLNDYDPSEINELKMAARNGNENLSQDIIDKMYEKHRKSEMMKVSSLIGIKDLAETIALEYPEIITPLEHILLEEDLDLYYDNYGNAFDGMTIYADSLFHVHINTFRGNKPGSPRARFSIAHELAHYFIDNHRVGLKKAY